MALAPSPARADSTTPLAIHTISAMAVDVVHHRLFLAGDDKVDARTDNGVEVKTWSPGSIPEDLAVTPDSTRLLVKLGGLVQAYDTSTLAKVADLQTGCVSAGRGFSLSGTKLWFACSNLLEVMDLSVDPPTVTEVATLPHAAEDVVVNPAVTTQVLASWATSSINRTMVLVDTSQSPAVVSSPATSPGLYPATFSGDGAAIIGTRQSTGGALPRWSTTDLSSLTAFGSGMPAAHDVAVSANGYVVGGYASRSAVTDAWVYDANGVLLRSYDFGTVAQKGMVTPRGLLLTPDASRLFAVTWDGNDAYVIRVLVGPTKRLSSMTLKAPYGPVPNKAFAITGTISSGSAIPSGQIITVRRISGYGTVTRPSVKTTSSGAFTISDSVTARGYYTYVMSWSGDATHQGVTRSLKLYMKGKATSLSNTVSTTTVSWGHYVTISGHLVSATKVRTLSVYAKPLGGTETRIKTGTVDSSGILRATAKPTTFTNYMVKFAGDSVYEPASAGRGVLVRPLLSYKVSYSYGKSGSTYLFHNTVSPLVAVTLHPVRGGCLTATEQKLVSGSWKTIDTNSCLGIYSGSDMYTGYCGVNMYDDPRSGTYRVLIKFPGNKYSPSASLPWITYRYTT